MDNNKQSKLVTLIREIVRAEISNAFASVLREVISNPKTPVITESKRTVRQPNKMLRNTKGTPMRTNTTERRTFVKDPMLNDILNSTSAFSKDEQAGYGMEFDSEPKFSGAGNQIVLDINDTPIEANTETMAIVAENLTKDYSKLMSAINKKKGNS